MNKLYTAFKNLSPHATLLLWLGVWGVLNLVQAAFTGLADDEGYYFMFSQDLDWGYFDHPPMLALLIRMGHFLGGALGLRFFVVILQPLYIYVLYRIVNWGQGFSRQDANLLVLVAAALPIMQLYGLVAVPDAPLMMAAALFLLFYKRFTEQDSWLNTLLLGISVAALGYSKYQGVLVVVFAVLANPGLLRKWRLYMAGLVALLLLAPHFWWQYEHQWVSLRYHLQDRNAPFRPKYIVEYFLNLIAVFNPLFVPLYIKAFVRWRSGSAIERALVFVLVGFLGFFLVSSVRGHVQPQWVIPITFALIPMLVLYVRQHPWLRRYVVVSAWVTLGLMGLLRIEMVFNPLGIRYQIFNNQASYGAIAQVAQGRPVIFSGSYAPAGKYMFYTGGQAYCQPSIWYRSSQWEYRNDDTRAAGAAVLVETSAEQADSSLLLANGRRFNYVEEPCFRPVRKVAIAVQLPDRLQRNTPWHYTLQVYNPYDYPIDLSAQGNPLVFAIRGAQVVMLPQSDVAVVLQPGTTTTVTGTLQLPGDMEPGKCSAGFSITQAYLPSWFNSTHKTIVIQ